MNADALYRHLFYGRDRAVTIGDLAEQLNVPRRLVERAAEELRATGAPLCSGGEGLYLSSDPSELEAQVDALRRRAIHQLVNARVLRSTARNLRRNRQMTLNLP